MGRKKKNVTEENIQKNDDNSKSNTKQKKKAAVKSEKKPKKKRLTKTKASTKKKTTTKGKKKAKDDKKNEPKPKPKKRGRKPKGGKIIHKNDIIDKIHENIDSNIVLHLKCKSRGLMDQNEIFTTKDGHIISTRILKDNPRLKPFNPLEMQTIGGECIIMGQKLFKNSVEKNGQKNVKHELTKHQYLFDEPMENSNKNKNGKNNTLFHSNFFEEWDEKFTRDEKKQEYKNKKDNNTIDDEQLWDNIKKLKKKLHFNLSSEEPGACFFCTYEFNTPIIYLPKEIRNGKYEVYGCFCSPECAVGYLKNEKLDHSVFCERYALLNKIYSSIYNYEGNIKPAPNPYFTLDKFQGNLSISDYRKLITCENIIFITDKPMVNIFPELFEDNNTLPVIEKNNLLYEKNTDELRLKRNQSQNSKKYILNNVFNMK